jgi:tetraacyldisaccharide 4'-kinase
VDVTSGAAFDAAERNFSSVAAFCGLANPASFWRSLDAAGLTAPLKWSFGDHHVYRASELRQLAGRAATTSAQALVTTEKDAMNLPAGVAALIGGYPLYYLEIGIEMDNAARFVDMCLG